MGTNILWSSRGHLASSLGKFLFLPNSYTPGSSLSRLKQDFLEGCPKRWILLYFPHFHILLEFHNNLSLPRFAVSEGYTIFHKFFKACPPKSSISGDCHPSRVFSWQTQFLPLLAHGIPHSLWNKNETELNVHASLVPLYLSCISISWQTSLKICQFSLYWHHLTTHPLVLYIRAMPSSWVTVQSMGQLLEYSPSIFSPPLLSPPPQVDKANAKFMT